MRRWVKGRKRFVDRSLPTMSDGQRQNDSKMIPK